jgi:hypothetical protein
MHGHRKPTSFLLFAILFVLLASLAGTTQAQEDKAKEEEAAKLGVEAVVYGFPLVIVDVTKRVQTNVEEPNNSGRAPVNQFSNFLKYPTAAYKDVVRMNVDTLYSFAWLDLSKEPIILSVPDTDGRYYLMPVLDAYTNVFVSPGKRTTGTKAGHFAIVGPDWKGELPDGVKELKSPTNTAMIAGRTQANGPEDYEGELATKPRGRLQCDHANLLAERVGARRQVAAAPRESDAG